jgi:hypothetical protein
MTLTKLRKENNITNHHSKAVIFSVILNKAKRSEASPRFQNNKISPLRYEMTSEEGRKIIFSNFPQSLDFWLHLFIPNFADNCKTIKKD